MRPSRPGVSAASVGTVAVLEVTRSIEIERSAEVVRRQFGDVAHHAATGLHRGVTFELIDDGDSLCRYRQHTKVGPLTLTQELELDRTESGPLVNRVVAGEFAGGSITFSVTQLLAQTSMVDAQLVAPVSGIPRLVAPVLRAQVGRQLAAALLEDKADLEVGHYGRG